MGTVDCNFNFFPCTHVPIRKPALLGFKLDNFMFFFVKLARVFHSRVNCYLTYCLTLSILPKIIKWQANTKIILPFVMSDNVRVHAEDAWVPFPDPSQCVGSQLLDMTGQMHCVSQHSCQVHNLGATTFYQVQLRHLI